jgi:zinc transport system substrate-binding protein
MQGVAEPKFIIDSNSSAHHFQFKPSQLRLLKQADLVIWIDSRFENRFGRLNDLLKSSTRRLEILPKINSDAHFNGHIWLSPSLLLKSITLISDALIKMDPANQNNYRKNATFLSSEIKQWAKNTAQLLTTFTPSYALDHDFLFHFQGNFKLQSVAVLRDSHDQNKSIRDLKRLEKTLASQKTLCILVTHNPASKLTLQLAEKFQLKLIQVDILGQHGSKGQQSIIDILQALSNALAQCQV